MRQNEPERPNDVRCRREQNLPLDQRLAHEAEFIIFQVTQPAMHELSRARRSSLSKISFFAEQDLEAAASGVARDAGTIDSAADDGEVDQPVVLACGRRCTGHFALLSLFSVPRGATGVRAVAAAGESRWRSLANLLAVISICSS
jgi:hypothetical protein